ncbi:MAG: HEAT repeat domain-containing protein [Bacteroidetes bacterium]|nr:HEAT repeat domain-containing protein [Bacteroidota bacterium]
MEKHRIDELIAKYNEGLTDPSEIQQLEKLIEEGSVSIMQLHELSKLDESMEKIIEPIPSQELDHRFYEMLAREKKVSSRLSFSWSWISDSVFSKLAVGALLVVGGFSAGLLMQKRTGNTEVRELAQEITGLKEMMMISLLENESATDRLKAVSLSEEIQGPSKKVTDALFKTLNSDPSVNVRLASLEALQNYSKSASVRAGLVRSIPQQDSPLVQVALAELMVKLQEKSSIKELKKIMEQKTTPTEVKQRIKESINVLI